MNHGFTSSTDYNKTILPVLRDLMRKSKNILNISINIVRIDEKLAITLINRNKVRYFEGVDDKELLKKVRIYLK